MRYAAIALSAALLALASPVYAGDGLQPYGTATDHSHMKYENLKIVMDAPTAGPADSAFQAFVANKLMTMPHTKLIMVIQGPAIKLFSKDAYADHQGLVERYAALRDKGVQIEFCGNSLLAQKLKPSDMIGIGTVVPGAYPAIADAERRGYGMIKVLRVVPMPVPKQAKPSKM